MIDVHAHFLAPALLERASGRGVAGVVYDGESRRLHLPAGASRPVPLALTDLAARREWNRERGIELQVLSPWLDLAGDELPARRAIEWARATNDTTAEAIAGDDGFAAFALLPMSDGRAAADELRRCVEDLSFAGAALPTQVRGRDLDDSGLHELFEAAAALRAPLFVHPFRVMAASRMQQNFLANSCGNPFETTLAATRLFFAGVLDAHPELRILLSHCGGALPFVAGRVAHGSRAVPDATLTMDAPEELLHRYFYDTIVHDPAALGFAIDRVGAERMALGTDAPFPMSIERPAEHLREALELSRTSPDDFTRIVDSTPARLLGRSAIRMPA